LRISWQARRNGQGTLGLDVNILTAEYGPRVYLTGILRELDQEPDAQLAEKQGKRPDAGATRKRRIGAFQARDPEERDCDD